MNYNHFLYLGDTALRVNKIVSISGVKQVDKDKYRFTVTAEGTTRLFTYTNNDENIAREERTRFMTAVNQELDKLMEYKHDRL